MTAYKELQAANQPGALNVIVLFTDGQPNGITANFNNTVSVVGAYTVTPKLLTASATAAPSKVYDGNITVNNPALGLGGVVGADGVSVSGTGVYADKNAGKPPHVLEKIVESGLKTYYKEVCLVDQAFVHDSSKSVAQAVKEAEKTVGAPIVIKGFVRYALGEGIEKPVEEA